MAVVSTSGEAFAFGTSDSGERMIADANSVLANSVARALIRTLSLTTINPGESGIAVAVTVHADSVVVAVSGTANLRAIFACVI